MGKIIIVAESGSDVPADLRERYGIRIVPMHVIFGRETREDGTFPPSEVIDYYRRTGKIPSTSGAMEYDFSRVFGEILAQEKDASVLHIAYSAVTTCSFDCARRAAEEFPQMPFAQVDTGMFSYGHYSVVIKTARMLEEHPEWSLEDAGKAARDLVDHSCMAFVPDGFEFLKAGGGPQYGGPRGGTAEDPPPHRHDRRVSGTCQKIPGPHGTGDPSHDPGLCKRI